MEQIIVKSLAHFTMRELVSLVLIPYCKWRKAG